MVPLIKVGKAVGAVKPQEAKDWTGVAVVAIGAVITAAVKAQEAHADWKEKKQDPAHKRVEMEKHYNAARRHLVDAQDSPVDSKRRRRDLNKAAKEISEAFLYATQLEAEKEIPLIRELQDEIKALLNTTGAHPATSSTPSNP